MEELVNQVDSYVEKTKQYGSMSFEQKESLAGISLFAELLESGRMLGRRVNALAQEEKRNPLLDRMITAVQENELPLALINVLAEIS